MYQRLGNLFLSQHLGSFEDDISTPAAPSGKKSYGKKHGMWRTWSLKKRLSKLQNKIDGLNMHRIYLTNLRNDPKTSTARRQGIDKQLIHSAKQLDKLNTRYANLQRDLGVEQTKLAPKTIPTVQVGKDQIVINAPPASKVMQGFAQTAAPSVMPKLLVVGALLAAGAGAFCYYKKHKAAVIAARRRRNRRK